MAWMIPIAYVLSSDYIVKIHRTEMFVWLWLFAKFMWRSRWLTVINRFHWRSGCVSPGKQIEYDGIYIYRSWNIQMIKCQVSLFRNMIYKVEIDG